MGEEREKSEVWSRMETAEGWAGYVGMADSPHLHSGGVPSHPFPWREQGSESLSSCEQKGTATLPSGSRTNTDDGVASGKGAKGGKYRESSATTP